MRAASVMLARLMCVLALVSSAGVPIVQYSWSPYGELLSREQFSTHTNNRLGHKGLFTDRLSGNVNSTQSLMPGVDALSFARNRHYNPRLGRWMQLDPNGTGGVGIEAAGYLGGTPGIGGSGFVGDDLIADGVNRHSFARSSPLIGTDALGLEFSLVSLMGGATTTSEMQSNWAEEVLDAGMTAARMIENRFDEHGFDQMMDVEWAFDWSAADDDYSKSGADACQQFLAQQSNGLTLAKRYPWNKLLNHHLVTRYGDWGAKFKGLLGQYGVSPKKLARTMRMKWMYHKGPGHSEKYWKYVEQTLKQHLRGIPKNASSSNRERAERAIDKALDAIEEFLSTGDNARILRDR